MINFGLADTLMNDHLVSPVGSIIQVKQTFSSKKMKWPWSLWTVKPQEKLDFFALQPNIL